MTEDFRNYQKPQTPEAIEQTEESSGQEGAPQYWASGPSTDSDLSFDDVRRIYVKTNYHRYHEAFEKCDAHGGIQASFSFAAFFFGWLWFLYRKMYREGLIILGASMLLNVIGLSLNLSGLAVSVAISTSLGIFGKGLYWMAVNRQIGRAMELSPTNPRWALDWLEQAGGVNNWVVVGGAVLFGLFFLALISTGGKI